MSGDCASGNWGITTKTCKHGGDRDNNCNVKSSAILSRPALRQPVPVHRSIQLALSDRLRFGQTGITLHILVRLGELGLRLLSFTNGPGFAD
jgi:hypothetical protein